MAILVISEHDNQKIKPSTFHTIGAATQLGSEIHLLIIGSGLETIEQSATAIDKVTQVIKCDTEHLKHQLPEDIAPIVQNIAEEYSHILAPASTFGKNILPRVAALLDMQQISDITEIKSEDTFRRPIYAGNAFATVQSQDSIKLLTVRSTTFDPVSEEGGSASVKTIEATQENSISKFLNEELSKSERPELTAAKIIVSGGRGLGSAENFKIIEALADKLDAAVGASRAAVDSGYVSNDYQVGQTGKVVAPELYIAVGISGAIQHLAGMKDSKIIVAINKDEDAPIFDVADYGLVADLFDAIPDMTEKL